MPPTSFTVRTSAPTEVRARMTLMGSPRWWARMGLLALAYLASGRLGMLLAIPPGFATAIFPPVGLSIAALLCRGANLWPGIWLGSLVLNVSIAADSPTPLSVASFGLAAGIAAGSTLQALLATWLIRKWVRHPLVLRDASDIFRFMVAGGPVSCLVAASVGVNLLQAQGLVAPDMFAYNWWNWWVGDCIGALVVSPLAMIWLERADRTWEKRRVGMALPLLLTLSLVILLFVRISQVENARIQGDFRRRSEEVAALVRARFSLYDEVVHGMARHFADASGITRRAFKRYVADILAKEPGIRALEWAPRVSYAEREEFERQVAAQDLPNFRIWEKDEHGRPRPAQIRSHYVPVTFAEPFSSNHQAIGFDLASNRVRGKALLAAAQDGTSHTTAPVALVQDGDVDAAILLVKAILTPDAPAWTPQDDRLRGYAVGAFGVRDVLGIAIAKAMSQHILVGFVDLEREHADAEFPWLLGDPKTCAGTRMLPPERVVLRWGDREYALILAADAAYEKNMGSWQAWALLAVGLSVASLVGTILLVVTGHAASTEDKIEERTRDLRDSESRTRAILDEAVEAIVATDKRGIIESANPMAVRLFGYGSQDLLGQPISLLIPSLAHEGLHNHRRREVAGMRQDGTTLTLQLSLSEIHLRQGVVYTAFLYDLTERQRNDRLKDEFVAAVSHELRTPLTSIRGSLGLIAGGVLGEVPEAMKEMVAMADSNATHLTALINDILDIQKLELGSESFHLVQQPLVALIQASIQANRGFAVAHQVELVWQEPPTDLAAIEVRVDTRRLIQVLTNLISNAAKFTGKGTSVVLSIGVRGPLVQVEVRDHGSGVPEHFRSRIFQKFSQAEGGSTGHRAGTGLGLSIAKSLVERMNGEINFRNENPGATFYFTLPIAQPMEASSTWLRSA